MAFIYDFQVGYSITPVGPYHNLSDPDKLTLKAAFRGGKVQELADNGGDRTYPGPGRPNRGQLETDLLTWLQSVPNPPYEPAVDPTPGQDHIFRHGVWVCDTTYGLETQGGGAPFTQQTTVAGTTFTATYYVRIADSGE